MVYTPAVGFTGKSWDEILEGKISWHNLVTANEDHKWTCRIYLNPESLDKVNKLKEEGLMNILKKDDDGYSMSFTRYEQKEIRGRITLFAPPIVLDKDGKPMSGQGIGHGSDIKMKLQCYYFRKPGTTKQKAVAARLEAVRVLNLVPYEQQRDLDTGQLRQIKGLGAPEPEVVENIF